MDFWFLYGVLWKFRFYGKFWFSGRFKFWKFRFFEIEEEKKEEKENEKKYINVGLIFCI